LGKLISVKVQASVFCDKHNLDELRNSHSLFNTSKEQLCALGEVFALCWRAGQGGVTCRHK
jgi:hypothetical protein